MHSLNRLLLSAGAVIGLLAGCRASVDPREDIALSARHVEERTGHAAGWSDAAPEDCEALWDGAEPLTARRAVLLALRGNPSIRADLARIAAARADLAQAGLLPNPVLSASLGLGVEGGSTMLAGNALQSLSSLWLRPSKQAAARGELQQVVLRVSDNAIALAAKVEASHRRVAHYQALLPTLAELREALARAEQAARDRFAAGMGTSLEANRLEAELLVAVAQERTARKKLDVEKRTLLELLNRADGPADWQATAADDPADAVPDEQTLAALARQQRLDVLAAAWSVRSHQARLRQAELDARGDLDAGVMLERENPDGGDTMTMAGPAVRAEVPVFDRGRPRIAKAHAELTRAQMQARLVEQQAIRQVRQASRTLRTAHAQVRAYRTELLPLAVRNTRQAQGAFDAGMADLVDVIAAQRDRIEVALALQQFELDRDLARIDLARAVGGKLLLAATREP